MIPLARRPAGTPKGSETSHRRALMAAAVSGAVLAAQQRLNGGLGDRLHDALGAALVSLCLAFAVSALIVAASPAGRRSIRAVAGVPRWQLLGGLGGAAMVSVGAVATPHIGVALLSVGIVAGQTSGGMLVDRVGLGPGGRHTLTPPRLGGALLCLTAVGIGLIGHGPHHAAVALVLLAVAAGSLASGQQALNGRMRHDTGNAMLAANVNFAVGAIAVVLVIVATGAVSSWPSLHTSSGSVWYLFLGGPFGVLVVWVASVTVRLLGVLRLSLAVTAGQLIGSLVLDEVWPEPGTSIGIGTVLGAVLTVIAVAVANLRTVPDDRDARRLS